MQYTVHYIYAYVLLYVCISVRRESFLTLRMANGTPRN